MVVNGHTGGSGGIKIEVDLVGAGNSGENESLRLVAVVGGQDQFVKCSCGQLTRGDHGEKDVGVAASLFNNTGHNTTSFFIVENTNDLADVFGSSVVGESSSHTCS